MAALFVALMDWRMKFSSKAKTGVGYGPGGKLLISGTEGDSLCSVVGLPWWEVLGGQDNTCPRQVGCQGTEAQ